jgi:hypothetical protein
MAYHNPFAGYNLASHNRALGQIRSDNARRRNEQVLLQLHDYAAKQPLPKDRRTLYAIVGSHSGKLPWSVLQRLAAQVRKETR